MPGRFPLTPVTVTGDPFCTDGFCGDPVVPEPPAFDPFAYEYVIPSVERWYGPSNVNNLTPTDGPRTSLSRYRTSEILGFRVYPASTEEVYLSPGSPPDLWQMTGYLYQISSVFGQKSVLNVKVDLADGSEGVGVGGFSGVGLTLAGTVTTPVPIARIRTTFLFYDSATGPVVASWPGYTFN
jgi:hypothetical protein